MYDKNASEVTSVFIASSRILETILKSCLYTITKNAVMKGSTVAYWFASLTSTPRSKVQIPENYHASFFEKKILSILNTVGVGCSNIN